MKGFPSFFRAFFGLGLLFILSFGCGATTGDGGLPIPMTPTPISTPTPTPTPELLGTSTVTIQIDSTHWNTAFSAWKGAMGLSTWNSAVADPDYDDSSWNTVVPCFGYSTQFRGGLWITACSQEGYGVLRGKLPLEAATQITNVAVSVVYFDDSIVAPTDCGTGKVPGLFVDGVEICVATNNIYSTGIGSSTGPFPKLTSGTHVLTSPVVYNKVSTYGSWSADLTITYDRYSF